MPKLCFTDPGLAAHLAGIRDTKQVNYHSLKGGLFESMIVSELLKYRFNKALENNLYYWRDKAGHDTGGSGGSGGKGGSGSHSDGGQDGSDKQPIVKKGNRGRR